MTTQEIQRRDHRIIASIESVFRVHRQLCHYAETIQVSVENAVVILSGELPSADLKQELIPAVRRAGVLSQVCDNVEVTG